MISRAHIMAFALADQLAAPRPVDRPGQSLSGGAAGIALLHIEHAGELGWERTHQWLMTATDDELSIGPDAGLYQGVSALAYTMRHIGLPGYRNARDMVESGVETVIRRRLDAARERLARGVRPDTTEFDLISGLTGLGALLRRLNPSDPLLKEVLSYLVELTRPIGNLPGWWTFSPMGRIGAPPTPGGLSNLGMAHGITGPLAFLSSCLRQGIHVHGQHDAISRICAHLDAWQQTTENGLWWPEVITLDDLSAGTPAQRVPGRPSWCYGTPGIARSQQVAGIVLADEHRRTAAETALANCLQDPAQMCRIVDRSLCHGTAGLHLTATAIAADALAPERIPLERLSAQLLNLPAAADEPPGFLRGTAGYALAVTALANGTTRTAWEECLLLT